MNALLIRLALVALAPALAQAQSFNVDAGTTFSTPSGLYTAGAAQPGLWNGLTVPNPVYIQSTSGQSPLVVLEILGAPLPIAISHPDTHGDNQALMDDAFRGPQTWIFHGVTNGAYEVFTYAWAPDTPAAKTLVHVVGSSSPAQLVGGVWPTPNGHTLGYTYAKHDLVVTNNMIQIECTLGALYATVNGVQIRSGADCAPATTYCTPKITSAGCVPRMSFLGNPSPGDNLLALGLDIPRNTLGVLFYSTSGPASLPFQGGFLCMNPPVSRFPAQGSGGTIECTGKFTQSLLGLVSPPGVSYQVQWWLRDPGVASGTGLSDAGQFTTCP